jgi:hypothetical protein
MDENEAVGRLLDGLCAHGISANSFGFSAPARPEHRVVQLHFSLTCPGFIAREDLIGLLREVAREQYCWLWIPSLYRHDRNIWQGIVVFRVIASPF